MAAALELFGTRGYAATAIEQLRTAAKLSTCCYGEFFGREDLLTALLCSVTEPGVAAALASAIPRTRVHAHRNPSVRRVVRRLLHRRRGAACCWCHQGDWHTVSRPAVTLLRRGNREGIDHDDLCDYFQQRADRQNLVGWNRWALLTLACPVDGIRLDRDRLRRMYVNVRHRSGDARHRRHPHHRRPPMTVG